MNAADNLRVWLTDRNLLPGYRIQFGVWKEGDNPLDKYAVIRPLGGVSAELVRRPVINLSLIGAINQTSNEVYDLLNDLIEKSKIDFFTDGVPFIEVGELTIMQTKEARPIASCDITFIQSFESDLT